MGLFRQQVLGRQTDRLHGEVAVVPTVASAYVCTLLLIWILIAAAFLSQASFARSESVVGWLEPGAGVVRVAAHKGGRVAQILVAEGDVVSKGQTLAVINGDNVLADGRHLEDILLDEYFSQQAVMQRSLARISTKAEKERRGISSNIRYVEEQLAWVDAQLSTLTARIELLRNRRVAQEALNARGLVSDVTLDVLKEQELGIENNFQAISASRSRLQKERGQFETSLAMHAQNVAAEVDTLTLKLSDLSQVIAKLRGERAYIVTASIDGVVSSLQATEGQRSSGDRHLMTIVPRSSKMVVKLLVPARSSGFLKPGQPLQVRYDAYPHQKFGLYAGTITEVSGNILLARDLADSPVPFREPAYQVSAALNDDAVFAYGERHALRPGMTLSAHITLEQRSVLEWLLDPLLSLRGRI